MNIILCGFMGSGKTVVGTELAKITGRKFVDTDEMVEKKQGVAIKAIFATRGEEYFRDLEWEVCKEVAQMKDAVISTGGGAMTFQRNVDASVYAQRVYGKDITAVPTTKGAVTEQVYLPMYGIVRDDNALMVVADKGDSHVHIIRGTGCVRHRVIPNGDFLGLDAAAFKHSQRRGIAAHIERIRRAKDKLEVAQVVAALGLTGHRRRFL